MMLLTIHLKNMDMNVKELRIGNMLKNGVVDSITNTCVWFDNQEFVLIDKLEPIPLTEEWLINFGFDKIGQNFRKLEDYGFGLGMTEFIVWFNTTKKNYSIKAINNLIEIETVHRLQNVYHALTGKELTHQKIN